jgi:hypothetical protein
MSWLLFFPMAVWTFRDTRMLCEARTFREAQMFRKAQTFREAQMFREAQTFPEVRTFLKARTFHDAWALRRTSALLPNIQVKNFSHSTIWPT